MYGTFVRYFSMSRLVQQRKRQLFTPFFMFLTKCKPLFGSQHILLGLAQARQPQYLLNTLCVHPLCCMVNSHGVSVHCENAKREDSDQDEGHPIRPRRRRQESFGQSEIVRCHFFTIPKPYHSSSSSNKAPALIGSKPSGHWVLLLYIAPVRSASLRFANVILAFVRSAFLRLAPSRFAP